MNSKGLQAEVIKSEKWLNPTLCACITMFEHPIHFSGAMLRKTGRSADVVIGKIVSQMIESGLHFTGKVQ